MRPLLLGAHLLMAGWLIVAAGRRTALQLLNGVQLDWSPFVSGGIGLASILLLITAIDRGEIGDRER